MPNPDTLKFLTDLRDTKNISLAEMANICGLKGNQSRKTASEWEQGIKTPRAERRARFMWYLWDDLGLKNNIQEFEKKWEILEQEWQWNPVNASEREMLQNGANPYKQKELVPSKLSIEFVREENLLELARKWWREWLQIIVVSIYKRSHFDKWIVLGGITAIVVTIMGIWFVNKEKSNFVLERSPIFSDDFSASTIIGEKWDLSNSQCAFVESGKLVFDLPQNITSPNNDWLHYDMLPRLRDNEYVSRINFNVMLLLPASEKLGYIGIETDCNNSSGEFHVYIGGTPPRLLTEYTPDFEQAPYRRELFDSVVDNKVYNIDINWGNQGIEVSIDGHKRGGSFPCSPTKYLNLMAATNHNESIKGYIDDFQVWGGIEE